MAKSRSRHPLLKTFIVLVTLCLLGWLAVWLADGRWAASDSGANAAENASPRTDVPPPVPPAEKPHVVPPPPVNPPADEVAAAKKAYQQGLAVLAGGGDADKVHARQILSETLAGGKLPDDLATECRRHLTALADEIVFSRKIFADDPYSYRYVVKPGDLLINVVKREKLYVPHEGILRINQIADARRLQVNQSLKFIRGPFDAIITRHTFTLDLYQKGMFVKSYKVGLGSNDSTPTGMWCAAPGRRMQRAPWTPPPSTGLSGIIQHGQEGYPLGKEGYWIALMGIDANTERFSGYGLHGTDEPDSIGKQASHGCVRLADEDIAELYAFLYDGADVQSRVEVRP